MADGETGGGSAYPTMPSVAPAPTNPTQLSRPTPPPGMVVPGVNAPSSGVDHHAAPLGQPTGGDHAGGDDGQEEDGADEEAPRRSASSLRRRGLVRDIRSARIRRETVFLTIDIERQFADFLSAASTLTFAIPIDTLMNLVDLYFIVRQAVSMHSAKGMMLHQFLLLFEGEVLAKNADLRGMLANLSEYRFRLQMVAAKEWPKKADLSRFPGAPPGLKNIGNTCFMNSVLQALYHTSALRRVIVDASEASKTSPILEHLQDLFTMLQLTKQGSFAPKKFYNAMPKDSVFRKEKYRQHDADEFLKFMLDRLSDKWLTSKVDKDACSRVFEGQLRSSVLCSKCKSRSDRVETFSDLSLAFPMNRKPGKKVSITSMLEEFLKVTKLNGKNKFFCDKCQARHNAKIIPSIAKAPDHLVVVLKRSWMGDKIMDPVECPLRLTLTESGRRETRVNYEQYAVVVHEGATMNSGHYYTIGRSTRDALCSRDVWYLFNDSQVKRSRDIESLKEWQTPYILFYVRSDLAYRQDNSVFNVNLTPRVRAALGLKKPVKDDPPPAPPEPAAAPKAAPVPVGPYPLPAEQGGWAGHISAYEPMIFGNQHGGRPPMRRGYPPSYGVAAHGGGGGGGGGQYLARGRPPAYMRPTITPDLMPSPPQHAPGVADEAAAALPAVPQHHYHHQYPQAPQQHYYPPQAVGAYVYDGPPPTPPPQGHQTPSSYGPPPPAPPPDHYDQHQYQHQHQHQHRPHYHEGQHPSQAQHHPPPSSPASSPQDYPGAYAQPPPGGPTPPASGGGGGSGGPSHQTVHHHEYRHRLPDHHHQPPSATVPRSYDAPPSGPPPIVMDHMALPEPIQPERPVPAARPPASEPIDVVAPAPRVVGPPGDADSYLGDLMAATPSDLLLFSPTDDNVSDLINLMEFGDGPDLLSGNLLPTPPPFFGNGTGGDDSGGVGGSGSGGPPPLISVGGVASRDAVADGGGGTVDAPPTAEELIDLLLM